MPAPGEPMFLAEDTAAALALAEEEQNTCPSCGLPKDWCRDPANQFGTFEPHQEFCWASYRLADYRAKKKFSDPQKASVQISARFAKGREPRAEAGLDIEPELDD